MDTRKMIPQPYLGDLLTMVFDHLVTVIIFQVHGVGISSLSKFGGWDFFPLSPEKIDE